MITFNALLWMFVGMFTVMGFMRGFKREVLITMSVVGGVFAIIVMDMIYPVSGGDDIQFIVRGSILLVFIIVAYHERRLQQFSDGMVKHHWRNKALGAVLGGANGFFIVTAFLYYLSKYNYPFAFVTPAGVELSALLEYSIPVWVTGQWAYLAAAVVILLVLLVFI
ncbi:MAG: CvpA family protein [Anaerolineales bacterium]|nr:CvpA family protein [Anaerolineales bacterium]